MKTTLIAAILLAVVSGTTPAGVDVAVRQVLQGYLSALNRGDFEAAAAYWSPTANVTPASLKVAGVTEWFFISSEMIDATANTARVQLNFTVKVAPGTTANYLNGRNVRFVRLGLKPGGWKIQSMTTSP